MGAVTAIDINRKRSTLIPISNLQVVTASLETDTLGDHDPDVIQVVFDLVYEGVNSNGDRFTETEMRNNYASLKNKPINWEHAEPNIGTITDAYLIENPSEPLKIQCKGVIWAWEYPEYADDITNAALLGPIGASEAAAYGVSMECYFHDWDYIVGDYEQVFSGKDHEDTFASLRGKSYGGRLVSRELKGIIFGGSGITEAPAEKKARLLAVASNKRRASKSQLFEDLVDSDFAIPAVRLLPLDKPEHVQASLEMFDSVIGDLKGNEFSPAQLREAHIRLLYAADKYGISVDDHECSVCSHGGKLGTTNDSAGDSLDTIEKEESEAKMKDEMQVVEAEEAEVTVEESEDAVVEETAEEAEVETEEKPEAEEEVIPEAEGGEFSVQTALEHLEQLILSLRETPAADTEAEAAAADEEELDEPTKLEVAQNRVRELESELEATKATLTGLSRLQELKNAGIKVPKESEASKTEFLAGLAEDAFKVYLADVSTAAQASVEDEDEDEAVEEATATLNLEDEAAEDGKRNWAAIFVNYKTAKN
jgi:hypothetical protein